jgi:ABC-2 type transport system permease protein
MMNIHRFLALTRKEFYQMLRDPSSFLIGIVIPLMLIVLMGSGLSLDVKNLPVAVALEDTSPTARDALSFLNGSPYFSPSYVTSSKEAIALMDTRQADAVLVIPPDFTSRLEQGHATVQILLYGIDATTANAANQYITSGLQSWQSQWAASHGKPVRTGTVAVVPRQWFNDANTSSWMFLPGLIVIVMTLVGVFLTALVMAREWERGTLEAIFATPVRPLEIIAAKIIPYFCIAMVGLGLCLAASYYGYGVPIHGSLWLVLLSSVEYVLVAIGMGLTISSLVKNQFLACQIALVVSLLPTIMLSGFLFDLRSVPTAISLIGHILPATYYMELLKMLFLAGTTGPIVIKDCLILLVYALLFFCLSWKLTCKEVS